ncbi:ribosome small subunit-dependent GTPase A [Cohnella cholangitidis]|uniref:Small ribosomal subunit biogenesis GTPase RsgA n=1 Tax=Cohnella cholangitidis TaxID=2598458 RepID=A0A7G5BTH0_9BACL|nr:ribosome small subunit-dependent GTPase A [Cohnella cholangitidis]QMV40254.1 ribosome small subunit-dependent GTPase A [Cohnella cholangitidis]
MPEGLIVKALSGYYYVQNAEGGNPVQCRGRGIFKKRGESPLVGDRVVYSETENGEGAVEEILPRASELIRPQIANADLAILVFSVVRPELSFVLLDKFLVHTEHARMDAIIVLTKMDRIPKGEEGEAIRRTADKARALYTSIGYQVLLTSAHEGEGMDELRSALAGHINMLAGQSGVGKSSLVNALVPGLKLETNEISDKLGRGKHTTRHVELVPIAGGGYMADTPGFSQLDFAELGIDEIGSCFREFAEWSPSCKFRGCTHTHEPHCAVLQAKEQGLIAESRYDNYVSFMTEWKETKRRY